MVCALLPASSKTVATVGPCYLEVNRIDRGTGVVLEGSSGATEVEFRKEVPDLKVGRWLEERSSSVPVQLDKHGNTVEKQYSARLLEVEHRRTLPGRG